MVQGPTRDHPSQNHTEDRSSVSLEHPAEQPSASRVLDMQQNETTPSVTFGDSSLGEGAKSEDSLPLEGGGAVFAAGDAATEGVEKQPPQSRHRQNAECLAGVSRGSIRASVRKFPHNGKFPSSQEAKSPPDSLQESSCSPLGEGASNEELQNSLPPEGA